METEVKTRYRWDQVYAAISPKAITEYMLSKGWKSTSANDSRMLLFGGKLDDLGNPITLFIGAQSSFADYCELLEAFIKHLSWYEPRSFAEILADLQAIQAKFENGVEKNGKVVTRGKKKEPKRASISPKASKSEKATKPRRPATKRS